MAYPIFIQDVTLIPAIVAFTGTPEEVVRGVWDEAKKKGYSPVLHVAGDMPESKVCHVCDIRARKDANVCACCGHIFGAEEED